MITYLNKMRSRGAATQAVSNFYAFSLFLNKIEIYFLELFTLKLDSFFFSNCTIVNSDALKNYKNRAL